MGSVVASVDQSFLTTEIDRIAKLFLDNAIVPGENLYDTVRILTRNYTDKQCQAVLTQTRLDPEETFIEVHFRTYIVEDLTWVDYWHEWLRILVARIISLEVEQSNWNIVREIKNRRKIPLSESLDGLRRY
jgi:hypothetical protein